LWGLGLLIYGNIWCILYLGVIDIIKLFIKIEIDKMIKRKIKIKDIVNIKNSIIITITTIITILTVKIKNNKYILLSKVQSNSTAPIKINI
jgi:hypothetical protein